MTIREALTIKIGMQTDPKLIDLALVEAGVDGTGQYTADTTTRQQLLAAEITVLSTMSILKSFSEGDLTIQYDQDAIQARLALLRPAPVVEEKPKPTINAFNW